MNHTKLRKALGRVSRALGVTLLTLAALALLAPRSFANVDQVAQFYGQLSVSETKIGGVATASGNQAAVSTNTSILDLFYNGSATAAYVTIGASSITFYAPFGVVDTSIGTQASIYPSGTFDLAASTMNTLGALCDAINNIGPTVGTNGSANGGAPTASSYHCTLTGGIRSDPASTYLPNVVEVSGNNNLSAVGGFLIPASTNTLISLGILPASGRRVVLNFCSVNVATATAAVSLQVFGSKAKYGIGAAGLDYFGNPTNDSTLAWQGLPLASNTNTTEPLHNTSGVVPDFAPWIDFGAGGPTFTFKNPPVGNFYNGHVVVRTNEYAGGVAQTSSNSLTCQWTEK